MKNTIISIWGVANQGKSATIKNVFTKILDYYPNTILSPSEVELSSDIKVILTIDNFKIGIESCGDPNSRLSESLNEFASIDCDIILCSTRTYGATYNAVKNLKNSKSVIYDLIWATNYRSYEKNQEVLNELSARQILELIQNLIQQTI